FLTSEAVPSQTDNDDLLSSVITLETEFDTEQSHTYDRARFKELPSITGDSKSVGREKQRCPPEQALATRKTRDQKQYPQRNLTLANHSKSVISQNPAWSRPRKKRLQKRKNPNLEIKQPNCHQLLTTSYCL
ncbi:unnamed protein product, partial [Hymenolepis diminuta]